MRPVRGRFASDQRGNVAILAALTITPISIASLGAVDLFRAASGKVELQDALDAASLAAARANTLDPALIQAAGERWFETNLAPHRDFSVTGATFTLLADGRLQGRATAEVRPMVAGLMTGGEPLTISAVAEVQRANSKLEIALVLDNTGSMAGSKLSNLKVAATNFVTTMQQAAQRSVEPDAVRISLVPFSSTVKVGATYRTEPWIDQTGSAPINNEIFTKASGVYVANRFTLFSNLGTSWAGCVEQREAPYDVQATAPSATTPASLYTPMFAPDEPDDNFSNYRYPNNYVSDNSNSSNWLVRQGMVSKYVPKSGLTTSKGPNYGCSLQTLQRLSTNWSALTSAISNMVASGDTNIPMGLLWGWNTLSPEAPFADGKPYNTAKLKKVVVLMTDGDNTLTDNPSSKNRSYYSAAGYVWQGRLLKADGSKLLSGTNGQRTAAMDGRLALLCQNMKASDANIEIYAIRVEMTSGASPVLENCATDANHYFDVQAASQLDSVFQAVAGQIANLHLSR